MGTEKDLSKRRRNMNCPICNKKEDTAEPALERQRTETVYRIKDNNNKRMGRSSKGLQRK